MREIKFRGWDEKNKEMVYNINLLFSNHLNECFEEYEECGLKIMQYTGLKDKNGVEIYEGDIVAFEDSDGGYEYPDVVINTGIVEYGELGFYFTNRIAVEMDDFYIEDGRCDDIEVIGNIHDNLEPMEAR